MCPAHHTGDLKRVGFPPNSAIKPGEANYWAFISYSHKDEAIAAWLHKQIETFRGHTKLIGGENRYGEVIPARIFPVFRDRDELSAAPNLEERIQKALRESRNLVVICSPRSANSRYVDAEIRYFKSLGRESKVFALIIAGEPHANEISDSVDPECFPEALKYRVNPDGYLTAARIEPLAADIREGKDGKRRALLKILAEILGVELDTLIRRDQERRIRLMMVIGTAIFIAFLIMSGLAALAWTERNEAVAQKARAEQNKNEADGQRRVAEENRLKAESNAKVALTQQRKAEANEAKARRQERLALSRLAEAQRSESIRLADTAEQMIEDGDATAAALVALEALPRNLRNPERPTVRPAVYALERALSHNREIAFWWFAPQSARCARFIDDDHVLVVTELEGVWRAHAAVVGKSLQSAGKVLWDGTAARILTTSDCRWLVAIDPEGVAKALDTSDAAHSRTVHGAPVDATAAGIDGTGKQLALSGMDGTIHVWDLATGKLALSLAGHERENSQLVFSPDDQQLASAGYDRTARVWWLKGGQNPTLIEADEHVLSVGWSESGDVLHVGSYTGIASSHDARTGTVLTQQRFLGEKIRAITPGKSSQLAIGLENGRILVWAQHRPNTSIRARGRLDHLADNVDGSRLVATLSGRIVWLVDTSHKKDRQIETSEAFRMFYQPSGETDIQWNLKTAQHLAGLMRQACAEVHRDLSGAERRAYLKDLSSDYNGNGVLQNGVTPKACTLTIWPEGNFRQ